jgi:hypothetical protein
MYDPAQCGSTAPALQACDYLEQETSGTLLVIDTEKEKTMGLGRAWEFPPIPQGTAMVSASTAARLGVAAGDMIMVAVGMQWTLRHALAPSPVQVGGWERRVGIVGERRRRHPLRCLLQGTSLLTFVGGGVVVPRVVVPTPCACVATAQDWARLTASCGDVYLPLRIHGVYTKGQALGKFPNTATRPIVVEYSTFLAHVAPRLHPSIRYVCLLLFVVGDSTAACLGEACPLQSRVKPFKRGVGGWRAGCAGLRAHALQAAPAAVVSAATAALSWQVLSHRPGQRRARRRKRGPVSVRSADHDQSAAE